MLFILLKSIYRQHYSSGAYWELGVNTYNDPHTHNFFSIKCIVLACDDFDCGIFVFDSVHFTCVAGMVWCIVVTLWTQTNTNTNTNTTYPD